MAVNGVKTTDLVTAPSVDTLLGNHQGSTVKISAVDLAADPAFATLPIRATFVDSAALLADGIMTYSTGQTGSVAGGDMVIVGSGILEVATDAAVDAHFVTAGGVKLYEAGRYYTSLERLSHAAARGITWPDGDAVVAAGMKYVAKPTGDPALQPVPGLEPAGDVCAEHWGFGLAGSTASQNATALQAANDYVAAKGGGVLRVVTPATIEGDFYLSSYVHFEAVAALVFNNGGFRVDGANAGAHVTHWRARLKIARTGTVGPAIFLGGDDLPAPDNKAAIRGVLEPVVTGSTGVGIELSNTFMVDIIAPNVRNCAAEGWKFHYGPQGLVAANAIAVLGGETQQCGRGYTTQGVSGISWHGHTIQGCSAENLIGENSRDVHHYGGYTELNGTTGYDFIVGDAGASPANISFNGMVFNDGSGSSKTHALKAVKCDGLAISDCRGTGYGTALIDFQPTGGGAVRGEWKNITGVAATDAAPNVYFRPTSFTDYVIAHTITWDIPSLAPGDAVNTTVAVAGVETGDFVQVAYSGGYDDVVLTADVSAADTVKIRARNTSASATRDPGNATYRLLITKQGWIA